MSLSLSEIESIALKAARGTGLEWGIAEEAAFAARWLTCHGMNEASILASELDWLANVSWSDVLPDMTDLSHWKSRAEHPMSALAAGITLSDHAFLHGGIVQQNIVIENLSAPALLLPFLDIVAQKTHRSVVMKGEGASDDGSSHFFCLQQQGFDTINFIQKAHLMTVGLGAGDTDAYADSGVDRCDQISTRICLSTDPSILRLLEKAHRTYVPSSDQSRLGAG